MLSAPHHQSRCDIVGRCFGQTALADSCSSEATLKAQPGGTATDIFFHNGSSEQRRVYWLDETGQRRLKAVVEAGKTQRESTVAGHPWVVTDGSEKCLHIVIAPAVPVTAEIGQGSGSALFCPRRRDFQSGREPCRRLDDGPARLSD